jgi:hypothetical protein
MKCMKKVLWIIVAILVVALIGSGIFWFGRTKNSQNPSSAGLSDDIVSQVEFPLYYFKDEAPGGFSLESGSVSYEGGVLIFEMKNKSNKKLVFTEQKTPSGYDISSLKADKEFSTATGKAFITDGETRTTAALFTSDGVWILINAPIPIGAEVMQQILNSLTQVNGQR